MSLAKQAKVLTTQQVNTALLFLSQTRNPERNRVILLLSLKAGLRAKEIALLNWAQVLNAEGEIGRVLEITNVTAKGKSGRVIPTNKTLRTELVALWQERLVACMSVVRVFGTKSCIN